MALWLGDFAIGPHSARYRGRVGDNAFHAHFAIQIVQGVDVPVVVETPEGVVTGSIVTIGSLVPHRLHRQDDAILHWIEPSSAQGIALTARQTAPIMIGTAPPSRQTAPAMDEAVRHAIGQVAAGSRSLARIARDLGMSPHRLRRAARAALGGSLRRWTLWLKLRRAVHAIAEGAPLAEAATAGGFADQAHLSRTMRAMFGITPGAFRSAAHGRVDRHPSGRRGYSKVLAHREEARLIDQSR